jgi:hypothetical protein
MIEVQRYQAMTLPAKAKARYIQLISLKMKKRANLTTTGNSQVLATFQFASCSIEV